MAHNQKPSQAERELQAYADELGILQHAQHLAEIAGCARATQALESALLDIAQMSVGGSRTHPLRQSIKPAAAS
jgi:hypothetical protein